MTFRVSSCILRFLDQDKSVCLILEFPVISLVSSHQTIVKSRDPSRLRMIQAYQVEVINNVLLYLTRPQVTGNARYSEYQMSLLHSTSPNSKYMDKQEYVYLIFTPSAGPPLHFTLHMPTRLPALQFPF